MLDIGIVEIGVVMIVALLVLGPVRLRRLTRRGGNLLGEIKKLWASLKKDSGTSHE